MYGADTPLELQHDDRISKRQWNSRRVRYMITEAVRRHAKGGLFYLFCERLCRCAYTDAAGIQLVQICSGLST